MAPPVTPAEVRFWRYVDKNGPMHPVLGSRCWLWTGGKSQTPDGQFYGRFRGPGSKMVVPQRFSWELANGTTDAEAVDHLCRITLCVNPAHLEPTTDRENILRGQGFAARNAAKTHCPQGHPYDATWQGRRYCKVCRKARRRLLAATA